MFPFATRLNQKLWGRWSTYQIPDWEKNWQSKKPGFFSSIDCRRSYSSIGRTTTGFFGVNANKITLLCNQSGDEQEKSFFYEITNSSDPSGDIAQQSWSVKKFDWPRSNENFPEARLVSGESGKLFLFGYRNRLSTKDPWKGEGLLIDLDTKAVDIISGEGMPAEYYANTSIPSTLDMGFDGGERHFSYQNRHFFFRSRVPPAGEDNTAILMYDEGAKKWSSFTETNLQKSSSESYGCQNIAVGDGHALCGGNSSAYLIDATSVQTRYFAANVMTNALKDSGVTGRTFYPGADTDVVYPVWLRRARQYFAFSSFWIQEPQTSSEAKYSKEQWVFFFDPKKDSWQSRKSPDPAKSYVVPGVRPGGRPVLSRNSDSLENALIFDSDSGCWSRINQEEYPRSFFDAKDLSLFSFERDEDILFLRSDGMMAQLRP